MKNFVARLTVITCSIATSGSVLLAQEPTVRKRETMAEAQTRLKPKDVFNAKGGAAPQTAPRVEPARGPTIEPGRGPSKPEATPPRVEPGTPSRSLTATPPREPEKMREEFNKRAQGEKIPLKDLFNAKASPGAPKEAGSKGGGSDGKSGKGAGSAAPPAAPAPKPTPHP